MLITDTLDLLDKDKNTDSVHEDRDHKRLKPCSFTKGFCQFSSAFFTRSINKHKNIRCRTSYCNTVAITVHSKRSEGYVKGRLYVHSIQLFPIKDKCLLSSSQKSLFSCAIFEHICNIWGHTVVFKLHIVVVVSSNNNNNDYIVYLQKLKQFLIQLL